MLEHNQQISAHNEAELVLENSLKIPSIGLPHGVSPCQLGRDFGHTDTNNPKAPQTSHYVIEPNPK
jgi:hypothetical protein